MSKLTIYRWDTHGHSSIKIKEICHFSFTSSSLHPSYPNQTEVPLSTEHHNWVLGLFITARKRSLGQGNIFYTCLSFCSRGVCYPNMHCRWYPSMPCRRVLSQHILQVVSQHALQGVLSQHALQVVSQHALQGGPPWGVPGTGGCLVPKGCLLWEGAWYWGVPGGEPPQQLLLWVVCILLECILVNPLFALDIFICSFHKCIHHTTRGQCKFPLSKL